MKRSVFIALAMIVLLVTGSVTSFADRGGRGGHGGRGHVGVEVLIGPWFGPALPFFPVFPAYPYYSYYPYYAPPAVVYPAEPDVYVQPLPQAEEAGYWYYCRNPEGYYPYVKRCPDGWLRVLPAPLPADQKKE